MRKTPFWIEGEGWILGPGARFDYFIMETGKKKIEIIPQQDIWQIIPESPGILILKPLNNKDKKRFKKLGDCDRVAKVKIEKNPDCHQFYWSE